MATYKHQVFSLLWVVSLLCIVVLGGNEDSWVLRPDAGVYFKPMGPLNAHSNTIYLAISMNLPELDLVDAGLPNINCTSLMKPGSLSLRYDPNYYRRKFNLQTLADDRRWVNTVNRDLRDRSVAGQELCEDYKNILRKYNSSLSFYKYAVARELRDIDVILDSEIMKTRTKRFILPALPFLVAAGKVALTLGGTAISYIRHRALMKSLEGLNGNYNHMNSHMVNYNNKSALYNAFMHENIVNLQQQVNKTKKEVRILANATHYELSMLSQRMENTQATFVFMINLLSKLNAHATTLISKNLYYLFMHRGYIRHFLIGAVALRKGELSPHLIGPARLATILRQTDDMIQKTSANDLRLLSTNPSDYYMRKDITYTVDGGKLIMQVPVPLLKKSLGHIELFQFQHVYVPFDTHMQKDTDYTSIQTPYDYIGITDTHYVLFTKAQMETCDRFGGYVVCPFEFLYIHKSRKTCLLSLFYGYNLGELSAMCDIRLHHNIHVPPALLETPTKFLLSGFNGVWSATCNGKELPTRRTGRGYALIDKESLCSCSLTTQDLYLASVEKSCPNEALNEIKPVFPVNSLAWSIFYGVVQNDSIPDISRLFDDRTPPPHAIPRLNIFEDEKSDVLMDDFTGRSIKITKIQQLLKEDADMYLTESDKLSQKRQFIRWFKDLEISQMVMSLLSMLGGLATIVLIFVVYKQCVLSGLVTSMVSHVAKTKALSQEPGLGITSLDWFLIAFYQTLIVIALLLLIYYSAKLVMKIGKAKRVLQPRDKFVGKGCKAVIQAEISDGLRVIVAYVATIRTHPALLHEPDDEGVFPEIIDKDSGWFQTIIHINWHNFSIITLSSNEKIKLPEFVTINFFQKRTLDKIIAANHTVRVAVFSEGQLWFLSHRNAIHRQLRYYGDPTELTTIDQTFRKASKPLGERQETMVRREIAAQLGQRGDTLPSLPYSSHDPKMWKEDSMKEKWKRPGSRIARVPSRMGTALATSEEEGEYAEIEENPYRLSPIPEEKAA